MGTIRVVPMGYGCNSSCTHKYNSSCTYVPMGTTRIVQLELYSTGTIRGVPIGTIRVVPIGRDALASHAVSVYTRFSQAPSVSILAVGAEALSMTPSGDALFASWKLPPIPVGIGLRFFAAIFRALSGATNQKWSMRVALNRVFVRDVSMISNVVCVCESVAGTIFFAHRKIQIFKNCMPFSFWDFIFINFVSVSLFH